MNTRLYFLDNLKTFLIFLVILFHAGIVYQPGFDDDWIVSDPTKSEVIGLVGLYVDIFVMFIMFFISGYFIPGSMESRDSWGFIKSKFKRIMFPWLIAVFTLIPVYKAIFLYSRGLPQEEWFSYFHIFQRVGENLDFFANNPTQHWLWFLPVLFLFQLLYLALSKTGLLSINVSLKTGVLLTFTIGLIYSELIANYNLRGWFYSPFIDFQKERLLVYFMAFLLGAWCYKLRIFESDERNKKYYIISNIVLTPTLGVYTVLAINFLLNMVEPDRNYFFVSRPIDGLVLYISLLLSMLCFLHIFVYVFRYHFNKSNKIMEQLNNNSYHVYIIHMIVVGLLALVLINISLPAFAKYLILTLSTFIVCHVIVYAYRRLFQKKSPDLKYS